MKESKKESKKPGTYYECMILFNSLTYNWKTKSDRAKNKDNNLENYISKQNEYTFLVDMYVAKLKEEGKSIAEITEILPESVRQKFIDREVLIEENRKRSAYLKSRHKDN